MKYQIFDFLIFIAIFVVSVTLIEYNGDDWMLDGAGDLAGVMMLYLYGRVMTLVDHE